MREVFVPVVGMAPDDVVLTDWLKAEGEPVRAGEVLAVVETSKAELEIEAEADGVLGTLVHPVGAVIAPGSVIGHVLESGDDDPVAATASESDAPVVPTAADDDAVAPQTAPAAVVAPLTVAAPAPAPPPQAEGAPRHTASPRTRRLAALGQPEAPESPAPPSPVVSPPAAPPATPAPASSAPPAAPAAPDADVDRFRAAISASVSRSWAEIPHFAVTRELRVGDVSQAIAHWRMVLPGVTLTDLLLRALALALLERERRTDLDVGLAVATDRGVAIPVVRGVLTRGMVELVDARRAAVERARAGRWHHDDGVVPATTLSNLGAVGVDHFTGVVPYGQTNMLTVGRAAPRPVVDEHGELAVATTMQATLNVDHRSWDGLHAGQVLDRLARLLAHPAPLLSPAPVEETA